MYQTKKIAKKIEKRENFVDCKNNTKNNNKKQINKNAINE